MNNIKITLKKSLNGRNANCQKANNEKGHYEK